VKGGDHPGEALARIERRLGAHAGLKMPAWLVSSRVSDRMQALGLATMEQYLDALESRGELDALAESLRVGETSFFRHKGHMGALRRLVAPDLAARHADDKRVRAWSAGCASGEEPYTLAMLLAEAMPPERSWRLEVLATDISEEALAVARQGCYRAEALRSLPAALRDRWFERTGDGWRVNDELGRIVRFERRNLNEDHVRVRAMDVILCRNVLIYFDDATVSQVVARLSAALVPGGVLLVGVSESLLRFSTELRCESRRGVFVYRRPG